MKTFEYSVLAFRQQEKSPIEVVFVAKADEITTWAGVPRKSDELLAGYQRLKDNDRVDKQIVPFFQNPANSSPTAIIVSLRPESGIGKCDLRCPEPISQVPQSGTLTIALDTEKLESDAVFEAALEYVNARLSGSRTTTDDSALEDDDDEDADLAEQIDEQSEASGETGDVVHLGTVTLSKMQEQLVDRQNWSNPAFKESIKDYSKPASIIDGQHRAFAASRMGIPFVVCALYDAPWEEQVFQFTVVNLKPKRIPPSLITSIAGLSLTREEQKKVEFRLEAAGVEMAEVTIMSLVAYDETSPFADMVDMSTSASSGSTKLGYSGVKRLAKEWYRGSRSSLAQIMQNATGIPSISASRRVWIDQKIWFEFFRSFWSAIRNRYPHLWKKDGNKLFVASHLWALQEAILSEADSQRRSSWQIQEGTVEDRTAILTRSLLEIVSENLSYFPEELWTASWVESGFDTSSGRERLVAFFKEFIDEGKKSGVWKSWQLRSDLLKAQG